MFTLFVNSLLLISYKSLLYLLQYSCCVLNSKDLRWNLYEFVILDYNNIW